MTAPGTDAWAEQRTTVPRIALPIGGSRSVELTDRVCWALLGVAMVAASALILYLNRGTTFFLDELVHVYNSPRLDLKYVFEPVNGHLGITSKLLYKVVLETIGDDYVYFRVLHVIVECVAAAAFYALVKRRIGALPALAPTVVLLFFGSAYSHVVIPIGIGIFVCVGASLGALLALERGDRRGDVAACLLIIAAIATFSIGLAFLVGIAISVLLRDDRWRRAWIFAVPGVLYAIWWVWSQSQPASSAEETSLSNVTQIPSWIFDSLAAVTNSIAGIQYDAAGAWLFGSLGWGRVLAVIVLAVFALRLYRGNLPPTLWVALGILISYWCLGGLAAGSAGRAPASLRYMYPGAVMLLLVAAEAARGIRFSRLGLVALFAITAAAVIGNVVKLSEGALTFRGYSSTTRAQFGAMELARDVISPRFNTDYATAGEAPVGARAEVYFESADRYGKLGYTPAELQTRDPGTRDFGDLILVKALMLAITPGRREPAQSCEAARPAAEGGPVVLTLPRGGALLRARSDEPAKVFLGRFGDGESVFAGELQPGEWGRLRIPTDSSELPWRAEISGARSVQVCRPA